MCFVVLFSYTYRCFERKSHVFGFCAYMTTIFVLKRDNLCSNSIFKIIFKEKAKKIFHFIVFLLSMWYYKSSFSYLFLQAKIAITFRLLVLFWLHKLDEILYDSIYSGLKHVKHLKNMKSLVAHSPVKFKHLI